MELALQSLLGVMVIPMLAWLISENRTAFDRRSLVSVVLVTILLQAAIALILLKFAPARLVFDWLGDVVSALQTATDEGARFVFGYLAGGPQPFDVARPQHEFVIAFRVLPMILVLSALIRLLYHWGVLQAVVRAFAWGLQRTVGTSGPLATVSAASVFLGLVEAPLMIRPYLAGMGRGALFATMAVVMATVAGTVMALYASVLAPLVPGAAGHLLAASIMNVPGALMLARLAVPDGFTADATPAGAADDDRPSSVIDAIAQGTMDGLKLVASVAAMLLVFVALVALGNAMLAAVGRLFGVAPPLTLQGIMGVLAAPLALLIGIPWTEALAAGSLLGERLVLNELIAYLDLARMPEASLSPRSRLILTYALCGFANLGSLGILIGGLTQMVPERREEIIALAPRAMVIGFLATLLSAAIVGVVVWR